MQNLPGKHGKRRLAVMLLALSLILVYQYGFSWYFEAIAEQSTRIDLLQRSQAHAAGLSIQQPELEAALATIQRQRQDTDAYLIADQSNLGIAELVNILKQTVASTTSNPACRISDHRSKQINATERFERVSIHARLVCSMAAMAELLYLLDQGQRYLFLDEVRIDKQPARRGVSIDQLKIQFDLSAYLRAPN